MPFLLLAVSAIVFFVWYNWGRRHVRDGMSRALDPMVHKVFRQKKCKWVAAGGTRSLTEFHCQTCGVTAYSASTNGPKECKRNLRSGL